MEKVWLMERNESSNKNKTADRDGAIDILRVLGLFLIIMAHTSLCHDSASFGFNVRNFDVVMMVFVSGLSFSRTYKPITTAREYFCFIWRRFKRLVIPCWLFITVYLLFSLLMRPFFYNELFSLPNVILSYSLISGFGYVWIVRVFFSLSVVAPFMKMLQNKLNNHFFDCALALIVLFAVSFVAVFTKGNDSIFGKIVNTLVLQFFAYGAIYYFSISYLDFPPSFKAVLFAFFLAFTVAWCIFFGFDLQSNKYPPSSSYLSYGLTCSIFLYELFSYLGRKISLNNRLVAWLSKESFTIYFCHIFVIFFFSYGLLFDDLWPLQFAIAVLSSIALAYLFLVAKTGLRVVIALLMQLGRKGES